MKTKRLNAIQFFACVGVAFLSGCATDATTVAADVKSAEKAEPQYMTGSRMPVKDTTQLIGLKAIDQKNIRSEKMWDNNPGNNK